MFAIFEKLFRLNTVSPAAGTEAAAHDKLSLYSTLPPVWRVDGDVGVYRGLGGDPIATVENLAQAQTLCDTFNLADGQRPSRRLLDAIYREEAATLADK
jgi:hypothetical protein